MIARTYAHGIVEERRERACPINWRLLLAFAVNLAVWGGGSAWLWSVTS